MPIKFYVVTLSRMFSSPIYIIIIYQPQFIIRFFFFFINKERLIGIIFIKCTVY